MAGDSRASHSMSSRDSGRRDLLILISSALLLRCGTVVVLHDHLIDDRDVYLALASGIRESRGLSVPATEQPTAFRPPLYPMLLAAATIVSEPVGVAGLNLLLGVGAVCLTSLIGVRLGLPRWSALLAGAIISLDPLLLLYTTFPMTETLCAFLAAALLCTMARRDSEQGGTPAGRVIVTGILFGLCVLARPTFWAFGGLFALWRLVNCTLVASNAKSFWRAAGITLAAITLTVSAWPIRNAFVLGQPVLTTTHGGYTLLLGNNPAFYEEVVRQPWGTVWDGSHGPGQVVWADGINADMDRLGVTGEVARDRWMAARARDNIQAEPGAFMRASLLRFVRFWNVAPSGPAADAVPAVLIWIVAGWYALLYIAAAYGAFHVLRTRQRTWLPALLLMAGFTLVHLVYWSNARMRAPVMPAVAVLAAGGIAQSRFLKVDKT